MEKSPLKKILVVDTDNGVRHQCIRILGEAGYAVECADNGADGLAKLETAVYDLIIAEMQMPGVDGICMYTSAVEARPALAKNFLFMIGKMTSEAENFFSLIKAHYLTKPISSSDLVDYVEALTESDS